MDTQEEIKAIDNSADIPKTEPATGSAGRTRPKKWRYIILGFIIGAAAVIAAIAALFGGSRGVGMDYISMIAKMDTIDRLIDKYYLYDADPGDISEGIFLGMLYGLSEDDYAEYYSPVVYEEVDRQQTGSYVGIGITVSKDEDTGGIRIEDVSAGGPADKAGIEIGDILLSADGTDLTGLDLSDAVSYISGEEGSTVELSLLRGSEAMTLTVTREKIVTSYSVHSRVIGADEIEGARMGGLKVGYISIHEFIQTTESDFKDAYETLYFDEEVDGLIIDLRNNAGGDVNVCLNMLELIIPSDAVVVYESATPYGEGEADPEAGAVLLASENKAGETDFYYSEGASGCGIPIVVLVNGSSASSSEIFAGVLRDYGYELVGTRTFGKGIMQSVISLDDGSAVKFTTDQYRLPSGDYIHGVGIEPDIVVAFEEFEGVTERSVNYASGEEEPDMTASDVQVRTALSIIEERAYELYQESA